MTIIVMVGCPLLTRDIAAEYSWQQSHAEVMETGDLKWKPKPFSLVKGGSVRYIDFIGGRDDSDGAGKGSAWKHHPWDSAATGRAAACRGVHTYVFKRGVIYRGSLVARESGKPGDPIRLTSDPTWGEGEAMLCGSDRVRNWKKGAVHRDIPDRGKVWVAELGYAPRGVWMVDNDKITRIPLARTPNWKVSDPEDVMSEWYTWEQPQWWKRENHKTKIRGRKMHMGTDKKHLTRGADYYKDALVWTEWGIVMGTPFPTKVEAYDSRRKAVAFQGIWWNDSGVIITNNRYYLEDKPHYLDSAGEFWFEKSGYGGRLHLRLPGDQDPNSVTVEAARRYNIIEDVASAKAPKRLDVLSQQGRDNVDTTGINHVVISGLTFRFNNTWWNLEYPVWMHKQVDSAAIRLRGSSRDVRIANCRFEHVIKAVRIQPINQKARSENITVSDCEIAFTGDAAVNIGKGAGWFGHVDFMRNRLHMIGMRPNRQSSGHAVNISFPVTMDVAGNMLTRTYGAGLFLFGGKASGAAGDVPFARYLVHHNRVEQTLLAANDWGGIETWQGGPFYLYSNISANPNGLWNWVASRNGSFSSRLGFAYYLDGSFKNYLFNNIAWGGNNDEKGKLGNRTAFYEAVGTIHNSFFNNTVYRFTEGSNWSPSGGHHRFLGNLWSDISNIVFTHGKLKEDKPGEHKKEYPHERMAYGENVFHDIKGKKFGVFEVSGKGHDDFKSFQEALQRRKALDTDLGMMTNKQPMRDPANGDMRPASGSAAIDKGVSYFVPWGLYATVAEWNFYHAGNDVTRIPDEHWYMNDYFVNRGTYHQAPQFELTTVNVSADNYVEGPLENWTKGALKLNGTNQYAFLSNERLNKPFTYERKLRKSKATQETVSGEQLKNPEIHRSNFLIEVYFKTAPGTGKGILVQKLEQTGYGLSLNSKGTVTLTAKSKTATGSLDSKSRVNDGKWHHVIAEGDRELKSLTIYIDGKKESSRDALGPDSLANGADLYVGGSPRGDCLKGSVEFVRICHGTLKDAQTTIEELTAWQFHGPQHGDFLGNKPSGSRRDAGAIEFIK